jgi:hypothetical protein
LALRLQPTAEHGEPGSYRLGALARALMRCAVPARLLGGVLGDLEEEAQGRSFAGPRHARMWMLAQVCALATE